VTRLNPYLPFELVRLWGLIIYNEPPAEIAERCRQIAAAYEEKSAPKRNQHPIPCGMPIGERSCGY
jgi:hypothetical protein